MKQDTNRRQFMQRSTEAAATVAVAAALGRALFLPTTISLQKFDLGSSGAAGS